MEAVEKTKPVVNPQCDELSHDFGVGGTAGQTEKRSLRFLHVFRRILKDKRTNS